jgi:DNA-binding MarR family transcriptional regulator
MAKNTQGSSTWRDKGKPRPVGFLLKSLQHTLRQRLDEAMRKEGVELSFAHFVALFSVQREPGITGAQLARRAFVSAQTMNSVLRRLEDDGFIDRRPHPDSRRADSWSVKPRGLAELDRGDKIADRVFAKMLAPLAPDEIAVLEDCLRRCITALGGDTIPAGASAPDDLDAPFPPTH